MKLLHFGCTVAHKGRENAKSLVAASLARGRTILETSAEVGVSSTSIHRWLRTDPDFQKELSSLKREIVSEAITTASASSRDAALTLVALLQSQVDSCRLGAARELLRIAVENIQMADLEERLKAIEEQMKARPGGSAS